MSRGLRAGPDYISLRRAARVGPTRLVYEVDGACSAIAYLQELLDHNRITNIWRVGTAVLQFSLEEGENNAAPAVLLVMKHHHDDDPAALIGQLARLLPSHARAVIAEFHPDGPAHSALLRDARVEPEQLQAWLVGDWTAGLYASV